MAIQTVNENFQVKLNYWGYNSAEELVAEMASYGIVNGTCTNKDCTAEGEFVEVKPTDEGLICDTCNQPTVSSFIIIEGIV